jgi:hypothetical protein
MEQRSRLKFEEVASASLGSNSGGLYRHERFLGLSRLRISPLITSVTLASRPVKGHPCLPAVGAENLCHEVIFVDHAIGAVAPPDAEVV